MHQFRKCIKYVKKNHGVFHANCYCGYLLSQQLILISNEVQIIFITGPSKKRNTGVHLKHLPYGKSKIPIDTIERIKAVTSNEAGMYVHSAIAIYTIQNGLQTNLHHGFHLQRVSLKENN